MNVYNVSSRAMIGAGEAEQTIIPTGLRIFLLTAIADALLPGRILIDSIPIDVPAGMTFTLAGTDFPDCPLETRLRIAFDPPDPTFQVFQQWVVTYGSPGTYSDKVAFRELAELVRGAVGRGYG